MEWEIPCEKVEETFQIKNRLSQTGKICGAEYDEMADAIYLTMWLDEDDAQFVHDGWRDGRETRILVEELTELSD